MKAMNLEDVNVVEILDRVLDNGIVVDPSARVSLIGQDLHSMKGRVVVESVNTYL
jgi:gas vesicle protein GvpA/GvpJ/GvpM family